jgi:SAM-dependent methyltransferase
VLDTDELRRISTSTLAHYDAGAESFWAGTRDHDVSQNIGALLAALGSGSFRILDLGCGPGRDLRALRELGHQPVGLDGSARFVAMAREHSGCPVLHQDFLALDLPAGEFDGVFANASLFHVPRQELPRVLGELHRALRPGGVLFSSNPHGQNEEGWQGRRYGAYLDLEAWVAHASAAGFELLDHYYRPPGRPRSQQPWLATVFRRKEMP